MSQQTSVPTIRKFNPGVFQSDREVKEQFVVRHRALDTVLGVVKRNLASESCQHALIVAPRGMGKTMLLARLEAELRLDGSLASDLIPVRFMEESYEVADLTGFWLEVLFQLARECSRQGLDAGAELAAAHASFCARWRDTHLRLDVLAAIERGLASIDRRMVLMVENLQALSETWHPDDEWGLRRVLQTEPMIMLIGTATTRFKSLEDADRAFFELFRLVELGPLTTKECAALWNMATCQNLAARDIRPFEILTGGSPRLLVILAGVGHQFTLRQLLANMVGLIDEHTEYFRQCLESLPSGERRVFLALADLWEPALASAIADRARMDIRTTSVMLRRLTDKGAVSASANLRSRRYSVTERMFCFYFNLRRERNQDAVIRRFISFMAAFYDPSAATMVFADPDERDFGSAEPCLRLGMEHWVSGETDFGLEWAAARSVPRAGCLLQLGDFQAAEALVHEWLPGIAEIEGDRGKFLRWWAACVLFQCCTFRDSEEAIDVLGSMVEDFEPEVEYCVQGMTTVLMGAGALGRFLDRIPSVLEASPNVRASLLPVIVALRLLNREQVSAPPEVLEVASDVLDTIHARRAEGNPFGLDQE